jgi:hypothetical protein
LEEQKVATPFNAHIIILGAHIIEWNRCRIRIASRSIYQFKETTFDLRHNTTLENPEPSHE